MAALRNQAYKARHDGLWEDELRAWEAVEKIEPYAPDASGRIPIAKRNSSWMNKYNGAQEFIRSGNIPVARFELEQL